MEHKLKVLAVADASGIRSGLAEVFSRDSIALHHAQSGAAALILTGNSLYDLLVIEEPLADLPVDSLLSSLQSLEWASAGAPALVMAKEAKLESIRSRLEPYPARVLPDSALKGEIQQAVSELLGVSVRSSSRMMVNVTVRAGNESTLRCFQSENVSESGLLLRGAKGLAVGTRVQLEFALPDEAEPVQGTALVVRHTANGEAPGVGLRFVELEHSEIMRLRRFVDRNLGHQTPGASPDEVDEITESSAASL